MVEKSTLMDEVLRTPEYAVIKCADDWVRKVVDEVLRINGDVYYDSLDSVSTARHNCHVNSRVGDFIAKTVPSMSKDRWRRIRADSETLTLQEVCAVNYYIFGKNTQITLGDSIPGVSDEKGSDYSL
jgi:hypothetical protein